MTNTKGMKEENPIKDRMKTFYQMVRKFYVDNGVNAQSKNGITVGWGDNQRHNQLIDPLTIRSDKYARHINFQVGVRMNFEYTQSKSTILVFDKIGYNSIDYRKGHKIEKALRKKFPVAFSYGTYVDIWDETQNRRVEQYGYIFYKEAGVRCTSEEVKDAMKQCGILFRKPKFIEYVVADRQEVSYSIYFGSLEENISKEEALELQLEFDNLTKERDLNIMHEFIKQIQMQ